MLSLPHRLRYLLAWDHRLPRGPRRLIRALLEFYRRQARQHGADNGRTGTLTVIQRFGGGLNLNIHFHTLALDGVFSEETTGGLRFHPAPPPTPRPGINLVLYHGVLAPHARWRSRVVLTDPTDPSAPNLVSAPDASDGSVAVPQARPRHWAWAQLMERAFGVDVLACPRCAGRIRLVATVEDPQAIRAILPHA